MESPLERTIGEMKEKIIATPISRMNVERKENLIIIYHTVPIINIVHLYALTTTDKIRLDVMVLKFI